MEETTFRQPAVLVLQVWDYDRIGANDFLGETQRPTTFSLFVCSCKVIPQMCVPVRYSWEAFRVSV